MKRYTFLLLRNNIVLLKVLWRMDRIGIHSKLIRTIPIHSDICIRPIANHSKPTRKTFCDSSDGIWYKNRSDLIRFNSRQLSAWIRTNLKPSFQSRLIRINLSSDWSKPNFQSESIRINPRSEWFGYILIENSVWINPSSN